MKKYIIVDVTQEDIDGGHVGHTRSCPIARAIKRQEKPGLLRRVAGTENRDVHVFGGWADVDTYQYKLPALASKFIQEYDSAREVHPFWFLMEKY